MQIIYPNEKFEPKIELAATVGFFDGVHVGHRFLIDELIKTANNQKLKSAVFTFMKHPRKVLHADFQPLLLTTSNEKLAQLAKTGIDYCIVLDFTTEMSMLSASEFLNQILRKQFNVSTLLVGHDHRFGHNRMESYPEYKIYGEKLGMNVIQSTRFALPDNTHISSSDIRKSLSEGNITLANKLLNYNYSFVGKVIDGFKNGRKLGFPTANLQPIDSEKLIPTTGVYAVKVLIHNIYYSGMLNIGNRPTLENGHHRSIEVNIFDFEQDIYNQEIMLILIAKIRDEQKFNSLDELISQLKQDKLKSIQLLNLQQ
ncbi:MAG: riboflavin biosynthesis protein RibF [Paludibacter sp.]